MRIKTFIACCTAWIFFFELLPIELFAIGDWASEYDFSDTTEEWNKQLRTRVTPIKFDEAPDFLQACQPLKDSKIGLEVKHPLVGLLHFRTVARRIGLAPLKAHYDEREIAFLKREMFGFAAALQMKMNAFKWIPHDLRDVSLEDVKQEEGRLNDETSSLSTKRLSLKKILYSRIPWRQLEGVGKFASKLGENRYISDERTVFSQVLPDLIKEFRSLTHELGNLIDFYHDEMIGEIKWATPPESAQFLAVSTLGSFVRDMDSLQRIEEVLTPFFSTSVKKNSFKYRYALLRILNVIGECSVTISPVMKLRTVTNDSWDAFKKVRNAFHDAQAQEQLHQILLDLNEDLWVNSMLHDFTLLLPQISQGRSCFDWDWARISHFYNNEPQVYQPVRLESILNLHRRISGYLTLPEERELTTSTRQSFASTAKALSFIKKTLLEDESVNFEDRKSFMDNLDQLKVSKSERKSKLEEPYKKRCAAQKEDQDSKLSGKDQVKVRDVLDAVEKKQEELERIAQNIHSYEQWNNLEKKLKEIGLTTVEDLTVWEKYHKLTKLRRPNQEKKSYTTEQKVAMLCGRINDVLKKLNSLFSDYKKVSPTERIDTFLKDSITSLAGQYIIGCFRQDAQNLWDVLTSAASGQRNIFSRAAATLDQYILRAKEILHNHDVTEISTLTRMGEDIVVVFRDIPLLLGDLFGIDFVLKNATINMSLKTGHAFKLPVVDARRLIPKKKRTEKNRGVKKNDYPTLTQDERFGAQLWLETSKNKNFPLKEFYDNLTLSPSLNPRYILYTPPQKREDLFSILSDLTSKKVKFPKPSQKPSHHEVEIISEHVGILNTAEIGFEEISIPEDNDCALHCLGLSRKEAAKLLLDNSSDQEIRDLVGDEIFEAFIEGGIPKKMQDEAYRELHDRYLHAEGNLDEAVREANNQVGVSGKTAHELLDLYSAEDYPILVLLKEKLQECVSINQEVLAYAHQKETFEKFVRFYVGQSGQWLSYIRGLGHDTRTTSLDAIAKLKGISLTIWVKDPKTQHLYVVHSFDGGITKKVNMLHTHGMTHFNLLRDK
ncbi:MAG: hypothetical protein JSR85_07580 [Proteobacteria bacterium]|nr:hypothetical protein [Pseudomonadota bacterium]